MKPNIRYDPTPHHTCTPPGMVRSKVYEVEDSFVTAAATVAPAAVGDGEEAQEL